MKKEILNKKQLDGISVVGAKLSELNHNIKGVIHDPETRKILIRIAEEDAKILINDIVDVAFYDYMNKTKQ